MAIAELMIAPFIIGLGHSVETDHLVAVGNLVDVKGDWLKQASKGASWGLGHTVSVVFAAICFSYIKIVFGEPEGWPFESLVGIMLILIGAIKIYRFTENASENSNNSKKGAFFNVGLIHGLAGSGTIAVLLTGHETTTFMQFAFLGLFGMGTIVGMSVITGFLTRFRILNTKYLSIISLLVAVISLAFGFKILINQFS